METETRPGLTWSKLTPVSDEDRECQARDRPSARRQLGEIRQGVRIAQDLLDPASGHRDEPSLQHSDPAGGQTPARAAAPARGHRERRVMPSTHRVIQSAEVRLPTSDGDRDFTVEFDAPLRSYGNEAPARPYLSYRVNPSDDELVHLVISMNGTEIGDQILGGNVARSYDQVFPHDVLYTEGNVLRVFVPDDRPGSVLVSDVIVIYTSYVDFPPSDSDTYEPSGGPL